MAVTRFETMAASADPAAPGIEALLGVQSYRRYTVPVLMVMLLLCLAPALSSIANFHGDERYYEDAAIRMVQSGDYLTPYYSDGAKRFKKPILTYWVLVASYKVLGINYFSTRLPFLLAACLTVWLTYRIALSLFRGEDEALIAAIVIGSNVQILTLALRSIPDIFLCFFISLSLYGFIRLIFHREMTTTNYAIAYLGAALAIETKGMLGALPVAYALLFCLVRKGPGVKPRELLHLKIIPVALFAAFFWFAAAYWKNGSEALTVFFNDQVGQRLSGSRFHLLHNAASYLWASVRHFMPYSLFIAIALPWEWNRVKGFFSQYEDRTLFAAGWFLLLFALLSCGNVEQTRYLIPAYPLLAALYAAVLARVLRADWTVHLVEKLSSLLLILGMAAGLLMTVAGAAITPRIAAGGITLTVVSAALYYLLLGKKRGLTLLALGLVIVVFFSTFRTFIRPAFVASPAPQLAQRLLEVQRPGMRVAQVDGSPHLVSKISVMSGGRIKVEVLPADVPQQDIENFPLLIFSENVRNRMNLSLDGYRIEECGYEDTGKKFGDVLRTLAGSKERADSSRSREPYYLAIRDASEASSPSASH